MAPEKRIFERKIYTDMLSWKNKWGGQYALLIEGARRVGKSTIVQEFARKEYESHLLIDFSAGNKDIIDVFEKYYHDVNLLLLTLQTITSTNLEPRKSVIVFDEVQHYPRARQLIKRLVEDGRFDYIETGSLISLKSNVRKIQIPSEEMHITMHPLDFEEWCLALGDNSTPAIIKDAFDRKEPLDQTVHAVIMEKFKTYMLVGGMPQAVAQYAKTHDIRDVEVVKKGIIDLYRDDMLKISGNNGTRARMIFDSIPTMLSTHRKNFRPGTIKTGSRSSYFAGGIEWLRLANICNICRSVTDPQIATNLSYDEPFKCYLLDTGLLLTLSFDRGTLSSPDVHMAFVRGKLSINEGMLFENVVSQQLVSMGRELRSGEFKKKDDHHAYEVDFILTDGKKIIPVEVKSSNKYKHTSLDEFMTIHKSRVSKGIIIHPKNLREDEGILYIPVYMTMCL